jgi:hypothetical protein
MKFHLALFGFVVFVLASPRPASACECIGVQGPFLRPGDKGIVATGRVVNIRVGNSTASPSADVEITEGFLNARSGTRITIYNAFGNCAYLLRQGEEYLFATEVVDHPGGIWVDNPPGSQAVTLCGRTKVLNSPEGQKMLAAIREERRRLRK